MKTAQVEFDLVELRITITVLTNPILIPSVSDYDELSSKVMNLTEENDPEFLQEEEFWPPDPGMMNVLRADCRIVWRTGAEFLQEEDWWPPDPDTIKTTVTDLRAN